MEKIRELDEKMFRDDVSMQVTFSESILIDKINEQTKALNILLKKQGLIDEEC